MQPTAGARRKSERVRPASAAPSSCTYAAGSPLPASRRRTHRVRPGSRRSGGRGRRGEDSDDMSETPKLLVTANAAGQKHADELPWLASPQPRPVRLTDRQARWLRASAGTAMLCRSHAGAGFARAAPSRDAKVQQRQLLGLSRKGFRHKIFLQDEDESDESDPVWAGGGSSPDGLFSGSIHKYLQAQRSMQINQRRARSACREMVCAVPHVPTAAASQRRGVKPKDHQRATARPSSAISSPLGIHSQPLILDDEPCPDSSYGGEKEMGTGMDGAADDVDQPDPDSWFPEADEAVDCEEEEEEWIEIDDSEFLGLDAEFSELDAARQMSSPSSSSGESDGHNGGEVVDEDGLIWVTAATLEESLDRSIAKGLSLKESLAEQTWWKERVADLEADQPSCEVFSRVSTSGAKKQELSPPNVQQRVRPGSARAKFGWDSPVYVAGGNQGRSSESSLCSGGATFRQSIFDRSFHTQVRLRTAGDCEADVEMLLQAARPTRMSCHREALSRSHTSQAHAARRFVGSEHVGAQSDDKGERREKRAIAHTQPGAHTAGRAAWADRAAPKVDDRKAQRSLAAPDDPWSHIQAPVSSLRPPSHALGTARRLSMSGDEAALAASCANDCQSEQERHEPATAGRWGSVPVEDTVCTRCSPVGCDGRSSPIAFHQGDGSVRVSANSLVAGGRSHSPTGAQSQGAIGRVPWEPLVKLAGAEDELSAASTPPLTSRRLARSAMLISSITGCGGEDLDAPSAAHCASAAGGVGKGVASGSGVEVWRGGFNAPMAVLERQSDKDAAEAVPSCPATPVLRHRRSAQAQATSPMGPSAGPTSRPDSAVLGGQAGRWRMEVKAVVGGGTGDKCERAKGERGTKVRKSKSAKAGPAGASSGKTPQQACVGSHKSLRQHISLYKVLGSDI